MFCDIFKKSEILLSYRIDFTERAIRDGLFHFSTLAFFCNKGIHQNN